MRQYMLNYFLPPENFNHPHQSASCSRLAAKKAPVKAADQEVKLSSRNKSCSLVAATDLRTSAPREAYNTFTSPCLEPSPGQRAETASSAYPYQVLGAIPASGMTAA
ncbi:hypothetical protein WR25_24677 [Diploscapter pachys]|jgi:hypothetical protein|uniref:Uncharacterized protein n=1 Tax=Diploscapter pachys TaxID=2018661 RepID=A0A2A2K273_9BILA|nr:hypothetical protein [Pseudomonas sp. PONIH3]PAV68077.1 hypothetical protein WR25_24677 [Diploscapter pachys]